MQLAFQAPRVVSVDPLARLRPYQLSAVNGVEAVLGRASSALLVMATGCGKTETAIAIGARHLAANPAGQVVIVAGRRGLVQQFAARVTATTGEQAEIEMGDTRSIHARWIVCSVDSLYDKRLKRANHIKPTLVIVDEAHHAAAASFRTVIKYFAAPTVGLTATPDRSDEVALGEVFDEVAFQYEILDAINDGWLVPVNRFGVKIDSLDFSMVKTTAGDLNQGQLDALMKVEAVAHKTVGVALEHGKGCRRGLLFTTSIENANLLVEVFNHYEKGSAVSVDSRKPQAENDKAFAAHKAGAHKWMVNVGMYTEGMDDPLIDCVVMARPTKSRALYTQCLDEKTQILTDAGWMGIDDDLGDRKIAAYVNGTSEWQTATSIVRRALGGEAMWGISSPHLDIRVTAGHRMIHSVKKGKAKTRSAMTLCRADELPRAFEIPISSIRSTEECRDVSDFDLSFLGMLLSDGGLNRKNNVISLFQTDKYPSVKKLITETLSECGFKFGHKIVSTPTNFGPRNHPLHVWYVSKGKPRGRDSHLTGWARLSDWISSDGKSLTPAYEKLSPRQVGVLISAIDAGNGCKHEPENWIRKTMSICIANHVLADQLQSLLIRSGFRCAIATTSGAKARMLHVTPNKKTWSLMRSSSDGRDTWAVIPSNPNERVWCVSVPAGVIITRRSGKVAVVGNCVGRGTRTLPGIFKPSMGSAERRFAISQSIKPRLLVLDITGTAGRHNLVGPEDVLGGKCSDEVIAAAKRIASKGETSVAGALDEARRLEAIRKRQELREKSQVMVKIGSRLEAVDPFASLGMDVPDGWGQDNRYGFKRPTEAMISFLERKGMQVTPKMTRKQAGELIGKLKERQSNGRCTLKQIAALQRFGFTKCQDWAFSKANAVMNEIAGNGWRITRQRVNELENM
jgi:hypothetical protein